MEKGKGIITVYVLLFILLISPAAFSITYHVKKDGNDGSSGAGWNDAFQTISRATTAAVKDDQIWVAGGTYAEGATVVIPAGVKVYGGFIGIENVLEDRDSETTDTVIDGQSDHCCVENKGLLDGCHMVNGLSDQGAGIYNYGKVTHCKVYDNKEGGGIYNNKGELDSCLIFHNSDTHCTWMDSGVLYNFQGSVRNCRIYENTKGCSDACIYNVGGYLYNCSILNNVSTSGSLGIINRGGSIVNTTICNNKNDGSSVLNNFFGEVIGCRVFGNLSTDGAGGIHNYCGKVKNSFIYGNKSENCYDYYTLRENSGGITNEAGEVSNCLIYGNLSCYGGGVVNLKDYYYYSDSNPVLKNCTIFGNVATVQGGGVYNCEGGVIANCIICRNINGDVTGDKTDISFSCFSEAANDNGNMNRKPLFVNSWNATTNLDFHLRNGSPCIDSGSLANIPDTDLEGNPRPGGDGKVCMGAYESPDDYTSTAPLQLVRLYVNQMGDDTDGGSWEKGFKTINKALLGSTGSNLYEIWAAEGIYKEGQMIVVPENVFLYGSFAGTETSTAQRVIDEHTSLIDGEESHTCVKNHGYLDGFHVTKGKSSSEYNCGGIYNSRGTVNKCEVYGNTSLSSTGSGGIFNNRGWVKYTGVYLNTGTMAGGIFNSYGEVFHGSIYNNSETGINNYYGTVDSSSIHDNTSSEHGAGIINCVESRVINCALYNNIAQQNGGAVYNESLVKDCEVYHNNAVQGGGIYNKAGTILNSSITSNNALSGGGVYNSDNSLIDQSRIFGNTAEDIGGGIYNKLSAIAQSSIYGNTSKIYGGGIFNQGGTIMSCRVYQNVCKNGPGGGIDNGGGTIENCHIYQNISQAGGGVDNDGKIVNSLIYKNVVQLRGGGMRNHGDVINCTVYANSSPEEPGVENWGGIINSIIWKNDYLNIRSILGGCSYSCYEEAQFSDGNLRANPLFVNTSGDISTWDFRLQTGSPCIDAGTLAGAPATDIEGTPRPGNDGKICIGAYESPDQYVAGDPEPPNRFYVSTSGDNTDGSSWNQAFHSIRNTISQAPDDSCEIWVAEGVYIQTETVYVPGRISLYGGFAGIETSLESRRILLHPTVIDGNHRYGCFRNSGSLDGFEITNGKESSHGGGVHNLFGTATRCQVYNNHCYDMGGGIYNEEGMVRNCIVRNNTASNKGGGIYNSSGEIVNCIIHNNSSDDYGGGIYNSDGSVSNCTVSLNTAPTNGGGIYNCRDVINSIIWANQTQDLVNGYNWETPKVSYSCYKEASYAGGNIYQNPMFIHPAGDMSPLDFCLWNSSPCIDKGNPAVEYEDGCIPPGRGAARNDMGCYGGPWNCEWGFYVQANELLNFLLGRKAFSSLHLFLFDANSDQSINIADLIYLLHNMSTK